MAGLEDARRVAFLRLAEKRTNAVIERIRILSNCSNPYAYSYTDDDLKRIFGAIERELRTARGRFLAGLPKDRFTLND